MIFVGKNIQDKSTISLSTLEQDIIKNPKDFTLQEKQSIIRKLQINKDRYWIQCDCLGILVICQRQDKIYLRCKLKNEHKKSCIFYQKSSIEITGSKSYSRTKLKYYCPIKVTCNSVANSKKVSASISHKNTSKLGSLMLSILDDSMVNLIEDEISPIFDQLISITKAFENKYIDKNLEKKKISLSKFYKYSLTKEVFKKAIGSLRYQRFILDKNTEPFLIFSAIATKITDHSFFNKKDSLEYKVINKIETTSGYIDKDKSAPYFIFTLAKEVNKEVIFTNAFAMPIFSTSILMPVESNYERQNLSTLLQLKSKYNFHITKPLFPMCYTTLKEELSHRPDFVLDLITNSFNRKQIFIEVLGSANYEYLEKKEAITSKIPNYISIDAYKSSINIKNILEKNIENII